MNVWKKVFIILFLIVIICPAVQAKDNKWSNETEFSFVDTGGNTDVLTLSLKNLLKYKFAENINGAWRLGALFGETNGEKNSERFNTDVRGDYFINKALYAALLAGWLQDEFAGLDARYYFGPALGYKFIDGPEHSLSAEAGVDYVKENYTSSDPDSNDYARGRALGLYEYAFNPKNKLSQSLEYLHDFSESDNYSVNSVTALISSMSDVLSLKFSYEVAYDNEPALDPSTGDKLEDTDTILSATLVVNY